MSGSLAIPIKWDSKFGRMSLVKELRIPSTVPVIYPQSAQSPSIMYLPSILNEVCVSLQLYSGPLGADLFLSGSPLGTDANDRLCP